MDKRAPMPIKPTVLVISHKIDFSQHPSFTRLENQYQLIFYRLKQKATLSGNLQAVKKLCKQKPNAVVGFNDHTSLLASAIADTYNIAGPSPLSLSLIQDKKSFHSCLSSYDFLPKTTIIDINQPLTTVVDDVPLFIKPVKGSLSEGALKLTTNQDITDFLKNPPKVTHTQFDETFFSTYATKSNLNLFLLQPYIKNKQFTLDGFIYNNQVSILGITESIYDTTRSSFIRFDFPIIFSAKLQNQLKHTMEIIAQKTGFDNSFFNLEFFLNKNDRITVIEVNTRTAFVFEPFYNNYYQTPLVEMVIQLALNKKPTLIKKTTPLLGKSYILRTTHDAFVKKIPSKTQIQELAQKFQVEQIKILCKKGKHLSANRQDAYTYRYAIVDICGKSENEIIECYQKVKTTLDSLIVLT